MYAKLIDNVLHFPPQTLVRPDGTTIVGYNTNETAMLADGWKPMVATTCPDGPHHLLYMDNGTEIVQVWTPYVPEPLPDPVPMYIGVGVETPVLVLVSESSGYGIGIVADDAGDLVTYIDHQSPRPDKEELRARIVAAVAKKAEERVAWDVVLDALATDTKLDKKTKDAVTALKGKVAKQKKEK